jgi:hypothetical protein
VNSARPRARNSSEEFHWGRVDAFERDQVAHLGMLTSAAQDTLIFVGLFNNSTYLAMASCVKDWRLGYRVTLVTAANCVDRLLDT